MEIYFLGYFIIPLGIIFFIYSPRKLYELTVFSVPFTGAAVFQISNSAFNIQGIRPSMFLGALCLLRHLIFIGSKRTIRFEKGLISMIVPLFVMVLVACISLVMPIVIDGDLSILDAYNERIFYAEPKPLHFSFQFVAQFVYFLFGCLMAYYFAIKNNSPENLKRSIQIYLQATFFVCCWGILEFILFHMKVPYPAFIFNSNFDSLNSLGTIIEKDTGSPRISSVALEPSILSQQLLTAIPLLFWQFWEKKQYIAKPNIKLLLFLIIAVLILSRATSAWFGLFIFIFIILIQYLSKKRMNYRVLVTIAVGVVSAVVATLFIAIKLSEKLTAFSGIERFRSYTEGFSYFIQYPLLGIGWGTFPTWDLIVCIMTATGILGLFTLVWLLSAIFLNFKKLKQIKKFTVLSRSVYHSVIMLLIISQASGFIYHSQYFWFVLGISMSASITRTENKAELLDI